jgi:hypothetical protein
LLLLLKFFLGFQKITWLHCLIVRTIKNRAMISKLMGTGKIRGEEDKKKK